jgi:hypothetical protein
VAYVVHLALVYGLLVLAAAICIIIYSDCSALAVKIQPEPAATTDDLDVYGANHTCPVPLSSSSWLVKIEPYITTDLDSSGASSLAKTSKVPPTFGVAESTTVLLCTPPIELEVGRLEDAAAAAVDPDDLDAAHALLCTPSIELEIARLEDAAAAAVGPGDFGAAE